MVDHRAARSGNLEVKPELGRHHRRVEHPLARVFLGSELLVVASPGKDLTEEIHLQ